jgi:hypothetical protein
VLCGGIDRPSSVCQLAGLGWQLWFKGMETDACVCVAFRVADASALTQHR